MEQIVLASGSPRRRELLGMLGYQFEILPADADESIPAGTPENEITAILSRRKADAVALLRPGKLIVAADTIVVFDGTVLGKPKDSADYERMIRMLSGRTHHVYTGVTLILGDKIRTEVCDTAVTFAELTEDEISAYVASGEGLDKAGAYGAQGLGARLIEKIEGDFFNVVGLPLRTLSVMLRDFK